MFCLVSHLPVLYKALGQYSNSQEGRKTFDCKLARANRFVWTDLARAGVDLFCTNVNFYASLGRLNKPSLSGLSSETNSDP